VGGWKGAGPVCDARAGTPEIQDGWCTNEEWNTESMYFRRVHMLVWVSQAGTGCQRC
jgi:hypothetical protein